MKNQSYLKTAITTVFAVFALNSTIAQFNWVWAPGNAYRIGRLNPNLDIRAIGIGNFTQGNRPLSALHVDANLMTSSPDFISGTLFRTDGPSINENNWTMFTGPLGATIEKFRLFVPANDNNVFLRSSVSGANMQFQTTLTVFGNSIPLTRMTITDGLFGMVGIGNGFTKPQSQLHIDDDLRVCT